MEQQVVNLEEEELHPLQNQVVLKIIFDLLESSATFEDWKNIRLVCKLWHSETLNRWRSQTVLDLVEEPLFQPRLEKLTPSGLLIHWLNSNGPYKLGEKPYQNYRLRDQTINLTICDSSNLTASLFWSTVGPWMKNLILTKVSFETGTKGMSKLLELLIDKTPNLEHVTFDHLFCNRVGITYSNGLDDGRECTSLVSLTCKDTKEFFGFRFNCFPNLQKVRFECDQSIEFAKFGIPVFQRIIDQNPVENSKVTQLDMMNCMIRYQPEGRQTFRNIKFPSLEHLSVNLNYPPELYFPDDQRDNEFGRRMIANHRETLKVLETFCWVPPRFGDWAIRCSMPVLSKLFIWGNCVDNLDFLRFTPNLTLLHVDLYGFEKKEEMKKLVEKGSLAMVTERVYLPTEDKVEASKASGNLTGVVLPKLEYFQLNYKVSCESVQALGEWMPNLKIFKGVLNSRCLPIVCEVWPKLEKLHCLFGSEIGDEDVIGSGNGGSKKGVADLKYLRSFQYNSECDKSSLSNKSVETGFLKLKELTDLQICVSKDFSRESEDALTSRIQNVRIYRNYSENEDHKYWKCCRDKDYLEDISNYEYRVFQPRRHRIYAAPVSTDDDSDSDFYIELDSNRFP